MRYKRNKFRNNNGHTLGNAFEQQTDHTQKSHRKLLNHVHVLTVGSSLPMIIAI